MTNELNITGSKQKDGTYELKSFYSVFANINNITPEMMQFAKERNIKPMPNMSTVLIVDDSGSGKDTLLKMYNQQTNTWNDM